MKNVLASKVKKHSFLVHDKWLATEKAVKDLGYASAPSVNHARGFRLVESGWHSNDIESEFARVKSWLRARYGRLPRALSEDFSGDLHEYMYLVNENPERMDLVKVLVTSF